MALLLGLMTAVLPGETLWTRVFDRGWDDRPSAVFFDSRGSVIVTGYSFRKETDFDFLVLKYDSLGELLWSRTFGSPLNSEDRIWAACLDRGDNVLVTGGSIADPARNWDYLTAKYRPDGETAWVRRLDSQFLEEDKPAAITKDDSGCVYVTGASRGRARDWDFVTAKYSPEGETLWTRRFDGAGRGDDMAAAVSLDRDRNVIVAGKSANGQRIPEITAVKYSPDGRQLWTASVCGSGSSHNWPIAVHCDTAGETYVGGTVSSQGRGYDFALFGLDRNGGQKWLRTYDGPGGRNDLANDMGLDSLGNILVAGQSMGPGTFSDYAVLKYRADGDTCWNRRSDGAAQAEDRAWAVAVGDSNSVFVTGGMVEVRPYERLVTRAYGPDGDSLWTAGYGGTLGNSRGTGIATRPGRVAVAGYSYGGRPDTDIVVIVYRQ